VAKASTSLTTSGASIPKIPDRVPTSITIVGNLDQRPGNDADELLQDACDHGQDLGERPAYDLGQITRQADNGWQDRLNRLEDQM